MAPRKQEPSDPDKVVRQAAGTYRTADERFEIQQTDTGWFLIDSSQANELGQPLMHGAFGTLKEARAALAGARKTQPMPRGTAGRDTPSRGGARSGATAERDGRPGRAAPGRKGPAAGAAKPKTAAKRKAGRQPEPEPEEPPTWIDALPPAEGTEVRRLISALERGGIARDAEGIVRADREGLLPAVAARVIAHRLEELVDERPPEERASARALVARVAEILTSEGTKTRSPLPRWLLVEAGKEGEPPNRRIVL